MQNHLLIIKDHPVLKRLYGWLRNPETYDYSQSGNYFPKDRGGWKTIRLAFGSLCTFSSLSLLDLGDGHDGVYPETNSLLPFKSLLNQYFSFSSSVGYVPCKGASSWKMMDNRRSWTIHVIILVVTGMKGLEEFAQRMRWMDPISSASPSDSLFLAGQIASLGLNAGHPNW